jgi:glycine cleavage system H protein
MLTKQHSGNYYFTEQHQWIRVQDKIGFVGVTRTAKRELGEIHNIEIHTVGKDLIENQVFGRIRTDKYLCKLIMPMRGKILGANQIDYTSFNSLDKDIDAEEWIVKVEIADPFQLERLFTLDQYRQNQANGRSNLVKYLVRLGG